MSIRVNASGEYLRRTASLPSATAFTMCGWVKLTKRAGQYQYWGLENATANSTGYAVIGFNNVGSFEISNTGGGATFASSPTDETWFFWAITCSGAGAGAFKGYWAYLTDSSFKAASGTGVSFTSALMSLGNDSYDEFCNATFGVTKIYDAALSESELWDEMHAVNPVRTTSLHSWSIFKSTSDVADFSGNNKTWTTGGSISSEEISPVVSVYGLRSDDARGSGSISLAYSATGAPGVEVYGLNTTSFDSRAGNLRDASNPGIISSSYDSTLVGVSPEDRTGVSSNVVKSSAAGLFSGEGEGACSSLLSASCNTLPGVDQCGLADIDLAYTFINIPTIESEGAGSTSIAFAALSVPVVDLYGFVSSHWGVIVYSTGLPSQDGYGVLISKLGADPQGMRADDHFGLAAMLFNTSMVGMAGEDTYGLVISRWEMWVDSVGIPSAEAHGLVRSIVPGGTRIQSVLPSTRLGTWLAERIAPPKKKGRLFY